MKRESNSQFIETGTSVALLSVPRNRPFLEKLIEKIHESLEAAGKTPRGNIKALSAHWLMNHDGEGYSSIIIGQRADIDVTYRSYALDAIEESGGETIDFAELDLTQDPDLTKIAAALSAKPKRVPQIHGYTVKANTDGTINVGCEKVGLEVLEWVHEQSMANRATYVPPTPVKSEDKPKATKRAALNRRVVRRS